VSGEEGEGKGPHLVWLAAAAAAESENRTEIMSNPGEEDEEPQQVIELLEDDDDDDNGNDGEEEEEEKIEGEEPPPAKRSRRSVVEELLEEEEPEVVEIVDEEPEDSDNNTGRGEDTKIAERPTAGEPPAAAAEVEEKKTEESVVVEVAEDQEGEETSKAPAANKTNFEEDDVMLEDLIDPSLLKKQQVLREECQGAEPYPHIVLPNLFPRDFLNAVILEIKNHSTVNFKESDLFRVFQTIDLANLDPDDAETQEKLPKTLQLRQLLYSDRWRRWMEGMLDLEPNTLTGQVDCACNCHSTGCHLLCHDDVIGTRKVSYILYLTDEDWKEEDGGHLELYGSRPAVVNNKSDERATESGIRIPDAVPSKLLLPLYNHMACFVVKPGQSFHSVQEVLGEHPRLSLQGWYHAEATPDQADQATLSRLKSVPRRLSNEAEDTEGKFVSLEYGAASGDYVMADFSDDDRKYLSKFMDETYLQPEAMMEIRERFEEESSVQLRHFLNEDWVKKLKQATTLNDQDSTPYLKPGDLATYERGVHDGWKLVGPAHKQRFLEYTPVSDGTKKDPASTGDLLHHLKQDLMQSAPFGRFLKAITSLGKPLSSRGRIRRFRPGLDYTVAHYGLLTDQSVLDATLCFCAGTGGVRGAIETGEDAKMPADEAEPDPADVAWESGECGGFECYIAADDDDVEENLAAADEYDPDADDQQLLSVSASNNTLSLVYRDPGTMRFIKYLGSKAPSSRWDIAIEYEVEDDDEEEGEGGGDEQEDKENDELDIGDDVVED
jgi:Rps23 Pro-64 3,4-dihydroxylase Tpa1-like proline 4-hydroxylase